MPHIHTKPGQHDHTVSGFILRIDTDEPRLLFHMHKKLGKYMQFGGHIELHENPWQAIKHEITEESGYDITQLKILQPKDRLKSMRGATLHPLPVCYNTHVFDSTHNHTDIDFAFVADGEPHNQVARGESNDFILVSRSELAGMNNEKIPVSVKEIGLFIFDEFLDKSEQIPAKYFESE